MAERKKLCYGMVGGGLGAFIGAVHRKAIALEETADLVAGCFSSKDGKTRRLAAFMELRKTVFIKTTGKWPKKRPKGKTALILYPL